MSRGLGEQVVRVRVEGGALDEDDGVDAVAFEQRVEIARVEWARDGSVLGRHPRLRRVRRIPEVNVRIDDHREASQPDSAASAASVHASPYGNSYRASDSGCISML